MSTKSEGLNVVKIRLVKEKAPKAYRLANTPESAIEAIKEELSMIE